MGVSTQDAGKLFLFTVDTLTVSMHSFHTEHSGDLVLRIHLPEEMTRALLRFGARGCLAVCAFCTSLSNPCVHTSIGYQGAIGTMALNMRI